MRLFYGAKRVDYDLLKNIQEFIKGYEVEQVPLWQWEMSILKGYGIFRELIKNRGGTVNLDLVKRSLVYESPKTT
jgi:hypothetical protein